MPRGSNTACRVDTASPVAYDLIVSNYTSTVTFVAGGVFEVSNNFDQVSGTIDVSNISWRVSGNLFRRTGGALTIGTSKLTFPNSLTVTNPVSVPIAADLVWCKC